MEIIFSFVYSVLVFIAVIFVLVLVHELGHFLAAKLFGMRVERFSIGFPPRLIGKKIGDTDYCLSATPLGGYVKISGMAEEMDEEEAQKEPQPWEYRSKPVWQRIIVIVAGVVFNMILAYFIFTGIVYNYGQERIPVDNIPGYYVPEGSTAAEVGFETGDRIIAVKGQPIEYIDSPTLFSMSQITSSDLSFTVLRNGEEVQLQAPADLIDKISRDQDFITLENALPSKIGFVSEGDPAYEAGLQEGDEIVAINGEEISYWMQMVEFIQDAEESLALTIRRNGETVETSVTPDPESSLIGVGVINHFEYFGSERVEYGLFGSLQQGINETHDTAGAIVNGFKSLLTGTISVRENLGGPIAIANISAEATETGGMLGFWRIMAYLSITLAIVNILPIPMLDGGHLMFLIYEGVTRREPSMRVKMGLQQIGLIFLVGLMIFVIFNDILRIVN